MQTFYQIVFVQWLNGAYSFKSAGLEPFNDLADAKHWIQHSGDFNVNYSIIEIFNRVD